jgi:hypothetical protein
MLFSVQVVDNDWEYTGTFEAESTEELVELIRKSPQVVNCYDFWVTPIVKNRGKWICGLLNPDYVDESSIMSTSWTYDLIDEYSNGSAGIAIYFREKKTKPLNVLFESNL